MHGCTGFFICHVYIGSDGSSTTKQTFLDPALQHNKINSLFSTCHSDQLNSLVLNKINLINHTFFLNYVKLSCQTKANFGALFRIVYNIKLFKMRKLKTWILLVVIVGLASCSPKYYIPNTQNVPLISKKGETNLTFSGNGNLVEFQVHMELPII